MSRRKKERTAVSVVRLLPVTITVKTRDSILATVLDISPRGMAALTVKPAAFGGPLPCEVTLGMSVAGEEFTVEATVQSQVRVGDRDRYVFRVKRWGKAGLVLFSDEILPDFDRRRAQRIRFEMDEVVEAAIVVKGEATDLACTMFDISVFGACVDIKDVDDHAYDVGDPAQLKFRLPGTEQDLSIQSHSLRRKGELFVLKFDEEDAGFSAIGEALSEFVRNRSEGDAEEAA